MANVTIPDELYRDAQLLATDLGIDVHEITRRALQVYLDSVRHRTDDATMPRLGHLPAPANQVESAELDGTEEWLSTEPAPRLSE